MNDRIEDLHIKLDNAIANGGAICIINRGELSIFSLMPPDIAILNIITGLLHEKQKDIQQDKPRGAKKVRPSLLEAWQRY